MTVKDFLSRAEGIERIDLVDSEGFVIHTNVTAITVIPYLGSEIDTLEFTNNETGVPGDNDVKVIIKLLSNATKYPENRKPKNVAKYEKEHAPKFGKWISVKDELPPEGINVIVCTTNRNIAIDYRYSNSGVERTEFNRYSVAHWMPLPEPPKNEG